MSKFIMGKITEAAYNMCLRKEAFISSGGVRGRNGELIELIKPCNSFDDITKKISGKQNLLQSLSFVNVALSAANIGICAYGFNKTFKMLDEISKKLETIELKVDKIENHLQDDYKNDYLEIIRNMENSCFLLQNNLCVFRNEARSILDLIERGIVKLDDLCVKFNNDRIDKDAGSYMIFSLLLGLTNIIQIFSKQFYYECGSFPPHYGAWLERINKVTNTDFQRSLKRYLDLNYATMSIEDRIDAYNVAKAMVDDAVDKININKQILMSIPQDMCAKLPEIIQAKWNTREAVRVVGDKAIIELDI